MAPLKNVRRENRGSHDPLQPDQRENEDAKRAADCCFSRSQSGIRQQIPIRKLKVFPLRPLNTIETEMEQSVLIASVEMLFLSAVQ